MHVTPWLRQAILVVASAIVVAGVWSTSAWSQEDPLTCDGKPATIGPEDRTQHGNIRGTSEADVIVGSVGADFIDGRGGNDTICGGPGSDTIKGGAGRDMIFGESGEDIVRGGKGRDFVHGGTDDDRIYGGNGDDGLLGGQGDDTIRGGAGSDEIAGGSGRDTLYGHLSEELRRERTPNDGLDTIRGGKGNDRIIGGPGSDALTGNGGSDRIQGGTGNDTIDGGPGRDYLFGHYAINNALTKDDGGRDIINGGRGDDVVQGGKGRDIISGGGGKDQLEGGKGRDRLSGGSGRDDLEGNGGDDYLDGGRAADKLDGGRGSDTCVPDDGDQYQRNCELDACFGVAPLLNVNLLHNAGAEGQAGGTAASGADQPEPVDWDIVSGTPGVTVFGVGNFPAPGAVPSGGNNFFTGGTSSTAVISQDIDICALAEDTDVGRTFVDISGWLGGYASQGDRASAELLFLDHDGAEVADALTMGPVTNVERGLATSLLFREASQTAPVGTRTLRFQVRFVRSLGSSNDGYADNLSLVIS